MERSLGERRALAQRLNAIKDGIAREVTAEFLLRHPQWIARYGDRATRFGIEDAGYHLDFLAGAIEANSPESFATYARWSAGVLGARGIAPAALAENLEQIETALALRLPPSDVLVLGPYFRAALQACRAVPGSNPSERAGHRLGLASEMYLRAILGGHRRPALNIVLEAMRGGTPLGDIYVHVFQAALYEVGRLWERGEITVATEHMATAITQYVMAHIYAQLEPPSASLGNVVITGVQGELHQVGANMVADFLETYGWNVRFLGTNMPHSGIVEAVAEHSPAVLGISATMLFSVPQVVALIDDVRHSFPAGGPRILVGGGAFRHAQDLYKEIGADAFAPDLMTAQQLVEAL